MMLSAAIWSALAIAGPQEKAAPQKGDAKSDRQERFTLSISGEVPAEFAPVVGRLTTLFYESYPKLVERFEHPQKPAPRTIRLTFARRMRVPAYCTGAEIKINVDWLLQHPNDIGLLTHELTHAVQAYPRSDPGWLTEGIADYARQLYGPKEQPGWSLPKRLTARNSYRDSYRVTARFLVWLDGKHPGAVDKLHRRMQNREFTLGDFETATGKPLDTLWIECVRELTADGERKTTAKAKSP
jgi:hypothetical protein